MPARSGDAGSGWGMMCGWAAPDGRRRDTGGRTLRRGIVLLVTATVLWSGNYIAGRVLAPAMSAYLLNGIRWAVSAVLLWVLADVRHVRPPLRRKWKELSLLGFVGMFLFSTLTYLGLHSVPAAQAGMISGSIPIVILLLGVLILRERPARAVWFGVLLSVAGVVILVGADGPTRAGLSGGDMLLVGAAVAWGLYTVLGKRLCADLDPLAVTAGAAVYGALPSLAAGLWSLAGTPVQMTPVAWLCLLYVSTAASVAAYWLWTSGVHAVGASVAAPFLNLLPVWTVVFGLLLLREHVTPIQGLGGLVTVAGAVWAGRTLRTRQNGASREAP